MRYKLITVLLLTSLLTGLTLGCIAHNQQYEYIDDYELSKVSLEPIQILKRGELPEVEIEPEPVIEEYWGMSEDELNLLYAVVMQEGGSPYNSAAAVMSVIVNRVNNQEKWGWAGKTIIDQVRYPQQFCYSLDDYWVKYLGGNVPDSVKQAVHDVLTYGPVNDYDCFRGYPLDGCEQIHDNWYYKD